MLAWWRHRRENRRLQALHLIAADWEAAIADWPVAARYRGEARARLRELSFRLLLRKEFVGIHGLAVDDAMRLRIATMAAVPVLDRIADKGVIHKNKAARYKSRLNAHIKALAGN